MVPKCCSKIKYSICRIGSSITLFTHGWKQLAKERRNNVKNKALCLRYEFELETDRNDAADFIRGLH